MGPAACDLLLEDVISEVGPRLVTHTTRLQHPKIFFCYRLQNHSPNSPRCTSTLLSPAAQPPRCCQSKQSLPTVLCIPTHNTDVGLVSCILIFASTYFYFLKNATQTSLFHSLSPGYGNWKFRVCKLKKLLSGMLSSKMPEYSCFIFLLFLNKFCFSD